MLMIKKYFFITKQPVSKLFGGTNGKIINNSNSFPFVLPPELSVGQLGRIFKLSYSIPVRPTNGTKIVGRAGIHFHFYIIKYTKNT